MDVIKKVKYAALIIEELFKRAVDEDGTTVIDSTIFKYIKKRIKELKNIDKPIKSNKKIEYDIYELSSLLKMKENLLYLCLQNVRFRKYLDIDSSMKDVRIYIDDEFVEKLIEMLNIKKRKDSAEILLNWWNKRNI